MRNFIQKGDVITAVAPEGGVTVNTGVLIGSLFGVATTTAAAGAEFELAVVGVFYLAKATGAVTPGAPLYWDAAAKLLTTNDAAGANKLVGVATVSAGTNEIGARVRLNGVFGVGVGAGLAALLSSGVGASDAYDKLTDGVQTLLAANGNGEGDRAVLIIVHVDQVFVDDGADAQTVFTIGQTGTANKFMANTILVDAAAGSVFVFAGVLTEEAALIVTGTPAEAAATGGISVTALALPAAA